MAGRDLFADEEINKPEAKSSRGRDLFSDQKESATDKSAPAITVQEVEPEPEPERPNILFRSYDRAAQGLSDYMSSLAGDIYGEEGDPTERADYSFPRRVIHGGGSAIAPAVGDIGMDAITSLARTVAPETSEKVGEAITTGLSRAAQSPTGQAVTEGYRELKRENPYAMNLAEDVVNIGLMHPGVPARVPGLKRVDDVADAAAHKVVRPQLVRETARRIGPVEAGDFPSPKGLLSRVDYNPPKPVADQIQEVVDIKGFNPRKSYSENFNTLSDEVTKLRTSLDARLANAPDIDAAIIDDAVQEGVDRAMETVTLAGSSEAKAIAIQKKFNEIIADVTKDTVEGGRVSPANLMQVRRDLDNWLHTESPKVFDPQSAAATQVAVRHIRSAINDLVKQAAPDAGVAESLSKQSKILSVMDEFAPRRVQEAYTIAPQRFIRDLEERTGLRHPTTPEAVYQTSRSLAGQVLVPATALAFGAGTAGKEAIKKAPIRSAQAIAKALRESPRAVLLSEEE